ncbi:hypothetical protein BDN70DRAFT_990508 [Pholiota conissans]|uniref:Uncharacterized protein n=1 Tax=Pholiota conissans TaxID=109636 RepID=A0A9P5Z922_9AGAR|nr:hypothetical protein BDN70DRAFT_990508 [Pholiota conissans]
MVYSLFLSTSVIHLTFLLSFTSTSDRIGTTLLQTHLSSVAYFMPRASRTTPRIPPPRRSIGAIASHYFIHILVVCSNIILKCATICLNILISVVASMEGWVETELRVTRQWEQGGGNEQLEDIVDIFRRRRLAARDFNQMQVDAAQDLQSTKGVKGRMVEGVRTRSRQLDDTEHRMGRRKQASRWGAITGSAERSKDSIASGQMDSSFSDIFDDTPSEEYGSRILFRPFALSGDITSPVPSAYSGDSIASDDPFLPPGLGSLVSFTPPRTFNTCIQPGSAAASSSRSRMSFANRQRDEDVSKDSPTAFIQTISQTRVSRFESPKDKENSPPPASSIITGKPGEADVVANTHHPDDNGDPKAFITKSKTPTQIHRALSALSFWTPAPKIAVTIAPPVRRRRGGRRREKERDEKKEKENVSPIRDVFGERTLLQRSAEN